MAIKINPANRGKFTASAKRAGMGVQEFARHVLANKEDYSSTQIKRANFARNASKWEDGGMALMGYRDDSPFKNLPSIQIPSNQISMRNVSKPILAFPNNDKPIMMQPGGEYHFPNSTHVTEMNTSNRPCFMCGGRKYQQGGMPTQPPLQGQFNPNDPELMMQAYLRTLPEDQRAAFNKKWHTLSPDQKQAILEGISSQIQPPAPPPIAMMEPRLGMTSNKSKSKDRYHEMQAGGMIPQGLPQGPEISPEEAFAQGMTYAPPGPIGDSGVMQGLNTGMFSGMVPPSQPVQSGWNPNLAVEKSVEGYHQDELMASGIIPPEMIKATTSSGAQVTLTSKQKVQNLQQHLFDQGLITKEGNVNSKGEWDGIIGKRTRQGLIAESDKLGRNANDILKDYGVNYTVKKASGIKIPEKAHTTLDNQGIQGGFNPENFKPITKNPPIYVQEDNGKDPYAPTQADLDKQWAPSKPSKPYLDPKGAWEFDKSKKPNIEGKAVEVNLEVPLSEREAMANRVTATAETEGADFWKKPMPNDYQHYHTRGVNLTGDDGIVYSDQGRKLGENSRYILAMAPVQKMVGRDIVQSVDYVIRDNQSGGWTVINKEDIGKYGFITKGTKEKKSLGGIIIGKPPIGKNIPGPDPMKEQAPEERSTNLKKGKPRKAPKMSVGGSMPGFKPKGSTLNANFGFNLLDQ